MSLAADSDAIRKLFTRRAAESFLGVFFSALSKSGVEHVVVSPGSRSAPLAVAAARCPAMRCTPVIDERCAAFFALGLARRSRSPVALVCTSGTAAANYLPAIVEAHYARVPLVVLTADRPPELREFGAGQTIDQLGLYGGYVRRFVEMPILADIDEAMLRYAEDVACRAAADASGRPPGPVHLNWPLREPLEPLSQSESEQLDAHERSRAGASWRPRNTAERAAPASRGRLGENDDVLGPLAEAAHASERGVIVCGPLPAEPGLADAVVELGRTLGWPITADPTSQLRSGSHCHDAPLCAHADLLLRDERFATAHAPDVVLRIGDMPVTKSLRLWLEAAPPGELWLVDPDGERNDPSHLSTRVLRADPAELCRDLAARFGAPRKSAWLDDFLAADRRIGQAVRRASEDAPILLEPRITQVLLDQLPDGACLYVSSSMPIRDVDAFMSQGTKAIEVHANRGANGIDGVVSSAVGAAAHGGGPVVLLIGDLALLHDIGGLLAAKVHHIPLTIVVLNNDGGGIFSFLPIAAQGRAVEFEKLFQTPHGVTFEAAAALYDARYTRVTDEPGLRDALDSSLVSPEGVHIIEVPVEGDANVEHFRVLVGVAAQAIDAQASR